MSIWPDLCCESRGQSDESLTAVVSGGEWGQEGRGQEGRGVPRKPNWRPGGAWIGSGPEGEVRDARRGEHQKLAVKVRFVVHAQVRSMDNVKSRLAARCDLSMTRCWLKVLKGTTRRHVYPRKAENAPKCH